MGSRGIFIVSVMVCIFVFWLLLSRNDTAGRQKPPVKEERTTQKKEAVSTDANPSVEEGDAEGLKKRTLQETKDTGWLKRLIQNAPEETRKRLEEMKKDVDYRISLREAVERLYGFLSKLGLDVGCREFKMSWEEFTERLKLLDVYYSGVCGYTFRVPDYFWEVGVSATDGGITYFKGPGSSYKVKGYDENGNRISREEAERRLKEIAIPVETAKQIALNFLLKFGHPEWNEKYYEFQHKLKCYNCGDYTFYYRLEWERKRKHPDYYLAEIFGPYIEMNPVTGEINGYYRGNFCVVYHKETVSEEEAWNIVKLRYPTAKKLSSILRPWLRQSRESPREKSRYPPTLYWCFKIDTSTIGRWNKERHMKVISGEVSREEEGLGNIRDVWVNAYSGLIEADELILTRCDRR